MLHGKVDSAYLQHFHRPEGRRRKRTRREMEEAERQEREAAAAAAAALEFERRGGSSSSTSPQSHPLHARPHPSQRYLPAGMPHQQLQDVYHSDPHRLQQSQWVCFRRSEPPKLSVEGLYV